MRQMQTALSLLTQVHRLVVFRTDLLVYEDCHLHHERKGMQLEKIPKWKREDQGNAHKAMCSIVVQYGLPGWQNHIVDY